MLSKIPWWSRIPLSSPEKRGTRWPSKSRKKVLLKKSKRKAGVVVVVVISRSVAKGCNCRRRDAMSVRLLMLLILIEFDEDDRPLLFFCPSLWPSVENWRILSKFFDSQIQSTVSHKMAGCKKGSCPGHDLDSLSRNCFSSSWRLVNHCGRCQYPLVHWPYYHYWRLIDFWMGCSCVCYHRCTKR